MSRVLRGNSLTTWRVSFRNSLASIDFIYHHACVAPKDTFGRRGKWSKLDFPIFSYASLVHVVSHALWCPQCEINQQNIHLRPPAVKMANQLRDTNGNRPLLIKSFPRVMKFPSSGISMSFRFPGETPKLYKFPQHTELFLYQHWLGSPLPST